MKNKLNRVTLKWKIISIVSKIEKTAKRNLKRIDKLKDEIEKLSNDFFIERNSWEKQLRLLLRLSEKDYWYSFLNEYSLEDYANCFEIKDNNINKVSTDVINILFKDEPSLLLKVLDEKFCYYCSKPVNKKNILLIDKPFCSQSCLKNYKKIIKKYTNDNR